MQQRLSCFSHVAPINVPCLQKGHFPLVFHFNYFLFFFVNIERFCISRMILLADCTCNFFQAVSLHMVRVLFTAFGVYLSSSTGILWCPYFLAFETPPWSWDLLLNSLKAIVDLHFLASKGLIKYQDISIGLDSFFAFSDGYSFFNFLQLLVFPGLMLSHLL